MLILPKDDGSVLSYLQAQVYDNMWDMKEFLQDGWEWGGSNRSLKTVEKFRNSHYREGRMSWPKSVGRIAEEGHELVLKWVWTCPSSLRATPFLSQRRQVVGLTQGGALLGKQVEGDERWLSALLYIPNKCYLPTSEEFMINILINTEFQNKTPFFSLSHGQILNVFS